jgi:hypothetical protein
LPEQEQDVSKHSAIPYSTYKAGAITTQKQVPDHVRDITEEMLCEILYNIKIKMSQTFKWYDTKCKCYKNVAIKIYI